MEILDDNAHKNEGLQINKEIRAHILETAKWSKFLSVLGFIGIGIILIGVLILGSMTGMASRGLAFGSFVPAIIISIIYFFPLYYLFNYSSNAQKALTFEDQNSLNKAFEYHKSHYKFIGILTIVLLSLYALIFIFGLIFRSGLTGF